MLCKWKDGYTKLKILRCDKMLCDFATVSEVTYEILGVIYFVSFDQLVDFQHILYSL